MEGGGILCSGGEYEAVQRFLLWWLLFCKIIPEATPQWEAADADINVPSVENTELKGSPFKAWSRSVNCHVGYFYSQGFLHC